MLKPHDHLCLIYESREEWQSVVIPFISIGLKRDEKCIYIADTSTANEIRTYLGEEGIDVASFEESSQLSILHETETYTREGSFDPDKTIALLISETEKAINQGYRALRVTGEMTWVLRGHPGSEKLLEYEAKLNRDFFTKYPSLAICQYDRWKFSPEIIKGVIMTHPLLVRDNNIYHNFYYIPPGEFLNANHAEIEVRHWLINIEREQRIQEKLQESELRYRRLFETAQDAILILDGKTGQIIDANPFIINIIGYSREELLGKNLWEIGLFKDIRASKTAYQKLQDEGYIRYEHLPLLTKTGQLVAVEFVSNKYQVDGQSIIQCNIRDIRERRQAEEEKRQMEQKSQVASRLASVGEMVAGVAHEINNPLTGVIGYAQLLLNRENMPPDVRRDLAAINECAQRVADIVQRLLAFSHQTRPQRKLVDINELIENTLILRSYHLTANNIEVTTRLALDLPEIMADPGQLQQVLLNLIVNAEMAMRLAQGKSKLTITTKKSDNIIKIYCKDNGSGMKPEVLNRIFDPFFTTREVGQGTGLGLSLCYGIVTEHKGNIYAESKPGKGATFVVELPVVTENKPVKPVKLDVKKSGRTGKARILAVDDEQAVSDIINRVLTDEGHKVETVDNAADALKKIKGQRYKLIILDIKMPDISGMELYRRIQEIDKSLTRRVVFITGDVMGTDTKEFLSEVKAAHIEKPFTAEQLIRKVNYALTGGR
jgi:PAS domain S-box-containing protein